MKRSVLIVGAIAAAVAFTAAGCGMEKMAEPYQDAPRLGPEDMTGATIIAMPDGFGNVATKCVGDVRFGTLYHNDKAYGGLAMVVDPLCPKK
jgi:hypothetical protein